MAAVPAWYSVLEGQSPSLYKLPTAHRKALADRLEARYGLGPHVDLADVYATMIENGNDQALIKDTQGTELAGAVAVFINALKARKGG